MKTDLKNKKINVLVIFGGKSVEHDISIITGVQTLNACDKNKFDVTPIYITKQGKWLTSNKFYNIKTFAKNVEVNKDVLEVTLSTSGNLFKVKGKKQTIIKKINFAFLATHGSQGENGALQGYLEMCNVPYSSPNVLSSAVCMNKYFTKIMLSKNNVKTTKFKLIKQQDYLKNNLKPLKEAERLGYPVIVKPCSLGSSIGINFCKTYEQLRNAVSFAFLFDDNVLVEQCVQNLKEVNVALVGNRQSCEISQIEEVLTDKNFLTFENKYLNNNSAKGMESASRIIPANIDGKTKQIVQNYAKKAYKVLNCKGIVRLDFLIDTLNNQVYLNEVNTIPGSLSNYLFKSQDCSFGLLLNKAYDYAIKEFESSNGKVINFSSNVLSQFEDGLKCNLKK